MRSSNYKHVKTNSNVKHAKPENKVKKFSKLGSLVVTAFVVLSAVVIPSVTLIQNVEAVTNKKLSAFSIGDTDVFKSVIAVDKKEEATEPATEKKVKKAKKADKVEEQPEETAATQATEPETVEEAEETTVEETEPETDLEVEKNYGLVSTANVDTSYVPSHVELSDYDRTLLEGLVLGEAGTLGYNGAALVAQAVRDSMVLSGTTSVEAIIASYQYDASPDNVPSEDVKNAVSYIFDCDGYAVQHRILYFYASDMVSNAWHESQNFVTSYGNVRFFDKW